MDSIGALERCAYCRQYVPITPLELGADEEDAPIRARVAVCETCLHDGR